MKTFKGKQKKTQNGGECTLLYSRLAWYICQWDDHGSITWKYNENRNSHRGSQNSYEKLSCCLMKENTLRNFWEAPVLFISVLFGLRSDSLYETFTAVLSCLLNSLSSGTQPLFMVGGGAVSLKQEAS